MNYLLTSLLLFIVFTASSQHCGFDLFLQRLYQSDTNLEQHVAHCDHHLAHYQGANHESKSGTNYVIPVIIYIIENGGPENITDQQITSQMDALNASFSQSGLSFCLATSEDGVPFTEPTPGVFRITSSLTDHMMANDTGLKALGVHSPQDFMKIYVVADIDNGAGTLGYATFPGTAGTDDGIVMRYDAFGDISRCGCSGLMLDYDQGKVLAHEVGHWLNLYHTFQNGCGGNSAADCMLAGDRVCDTPPVASPNYGCPATAPNSCTETPTDLPDLINNHMDYTDDNCRNAFTSGQDARMVGALTSYRSNLISPANLINSGVNCAGGLSALFEPSAYGMCVANTITFTGSPGATSYAWDMGDGTQLTGNPVNHFYATSGVYSVSLTVSNGTETLSWGEEYHVSDCSNLRLDQSTWMFGYAGALDFTGGYAVATNRGANASPTYGSGEANIIEMDPSGSVLFSCNGADVYNDVDTKITTAPLMHTGVGSTSQIISVPDPANANQHYVIYATNLESPGSGIGYSIINHTGGGSVVTSGNLTTPGGLDASELITAIPHCNGIDYWVITHGKYAGNKEFWVYKVSASGITNAAGSGTSPDLYPGFQLLASKGSLKASHDGTMLAMTGYDGNGKLGLYDFDRVTGVVSNERIIFSDTYFQTNCAFSFNDEYIYMAIDNFPDPVYEIKRIDLSGNSEELLSTSLPLWGISLGPDQRMYVGIASSSQIMMIPNPEAAAPLVHEAAIDLTEGTTTAWTSLNFVQFIDAFPASQVAHDFHIIETSCGNYDFRPTNPCLGITYTWDFGDATSSSSTSPSHSYSTPGTYVVELTVNGTDISTHTVEYGVSGQVYGEDSLCLGTNGLFTYNYSTEGCPTCDYTWTVTGGSIISGNNSDNINISWLTNPASISVIVTDSVSGCSYNSTLPAVLNNCTLSISEPEGSEGFIVNQTESPHVFNIIYNGQGKWNYEVRDMDGRLIQESRSNSAQARFNLQKHTSGVYLISVYSNNEHIGSKRLFNP